MQMYERVAEARETALTGQIKGKEPWSIPPLSPTHLGEIQMEHLGHPSKGSPRGSVVSMELNCLPLLTCTTIREALRDGSCHEMCTTVV